MLRQQWPLVEANVPPEAWVAAGQSGTIGFMRDRVLNLDGRVNATALEHQQDMPAYLREKKVEWICDWQGYIEKYLGPDPEKFGWHLVKQDGIMFLYHYEPITASAQPGRG